MDFTFSSAEHRLLHFCPPQRGGPQKQPKQGVNQPKPLEAEKQILDKLEGEIDGQKAKDLVKEFRAMADKDAQEFSKAAKLKFEGIANAALSELLAQGKTNEAALQEIQKDFKTAGLRVTMTMVDGKISVELPQLEPPEPQTKLDALLQEFNQALEGAQQGDIKSVLKMGLILMKALQNLTQLLDPYESPKAKASREKKEQDAARQKTREKLQEELKTKTYADLLTEKQTAAADGSPEKVAQKKTELDTEKAKKAGLEQKVTDLTAKSKATPPTATAAEVDAAKAEVATNAANITRLEGELTAVQAKADKKKELDELISMKKDFDTVLTKVTPMLSGLVAGLKNLKMPEATALAEKLDGITAEDDGHLRIKITKGGNPVTAELKAVLKQFGRNEVNIGMDDAGLITDPAKFFNIFNPLNAQVFGERAAKVRESLAADITKKIATLPDAEKKPIEAALKAPSWVEVAGATPPAEIIFAQGGVYKQNKENPTSVQELNLSGEKAVWDTKTDQYFDGTQVKSVEADAGKRERGSTYENHTWRQKTPVEVVKELAAKKWRGKFKEAALKVLEAGTGWEKASEEHDITVVEGIVYCQTKKGDSTIALDHEAYIADASKSNEWKSDTGEYINASGEKIKRPNRRLYEYNRDKKEWAVKTGEDLKGELMGLVVGGDEKKLAAQATTNEGWQEAEIGGVKYEAIFKRSPSGDTLYMQEKGNPSSTLEVNFLDATSKTIADKYFNGTEMKAVPEADADKRKRGYNYENREYTKATHDEICRKMAKEKGFKEEIFDKKGRWVADGTDAFILTDQGLFWQPSTDTTGGKTGRAYRFKAEQYVEDGSAKWTENAKYLDATGVQKDVPSARNYEYKPDEKAWVLRNSAELKSVWVTPEFGELVAIAATGDGSWKESAWGSTTYESVMVKSGDADIVYIQPKNNPEFCHVVNLKELKSEKKKDFYFDGKELQKLPDLRVRGPYNQEKHTYEVLTAEKSKERETRRLEEGKTVLSNLNHGKAKPNGENKWFVDLDWTVDDLDIRFNTLNQTWEYSVEAINKWESVDVSVSTYNKTHDYWSDGEVETVQSIVDQLKPANALQV